MHRNGRYRPDSPEVLTEALRRHVDTRGQRDTHDVLSRLRGGNGIPARDEAPGTLPDLESWWGDLGEVHRRMLRMVEMRVDDDLSGLNAQKGNGRTVGRLKRNPPRRDRSPTDNRSGSNRKNTSGRPVLWLSKSGGIPLHRHRHVPGNAAIRSPEILGLRRENESRSDSSTPVGTALPTDADSASAERAVETGSLARKKRTASTVSECVGGVHDADSRDAGVGVRHANGVELGGGGW